MGDVFLAREQGPDGATRRIALRRIRPDLARDERFRELFRGEARIAIRLSHPNIVHTLEVGSAGDDLYLATEHVVGRTLRDLLHQAAVVGLVIPIEVAMAIALDVAQGLHHAHELGVDGGAPLGVVHRDLSPHAVLVGADGAARILDFGLAGAAIDPDEPGALPLGADPGYLSPEQARLEPLDRRSDIYSLGIMLWEMTAGERLYPVADAMHAAQVIGRQEVPSLLGLRALPPGWEGVLRRALAADRADRYPTARQLQLDVEDVARSAGLAVSSQPVIALLAALYPEVALDLELPRPHRHSVLAVGGDADMLELISRALGAAAEVRTAGSLDAALRALAEAPLDVILTDERLPDERGVELLARAAEASPRTARILMSADADPDLMVAAINRGRIDRFLVAPFMPDELRSMVEDALARRPHAPPGRAPPAPPGEPRRAASKPAGPPPVALPWESLRSMTDAVREDALSCALLVGVADQPLRGEEEAAIQWVLERRVPHCWLHIENRALAVLVPGIASSAAASLAAELRDAAFGVLGARLALAMAELPAGEDLADVGRHVERAAVHAWLAEAEAGHGG